MLTSQYVAQTGSAACHLVKHRVRRVYGLGTSGVHSTLDLDLFRPFWASGSFGFGPWNYGSIKGKGKMVFYPRSRDYGFRPSVTAYYLIRMLFDYV